MTIKEKIAHDISKIEHPGLLGQILQFIRLMRSSYHSPKSNVAKVLSHKGLLSKAEASEIQTDVVDSFHHTRVNGC